MRLKYPVILASSSPRRQDMLRHLGVGFKVVAPDIAEHSEPGEAPAAHAGRLALAKGRRTAALLGPAPRPRIIIAGDTVVALGDTILGKPRDDRDARRMLRLLSGHTHEVISGLAVLLKQGDRLVREACVVETTRVGFRALTAREIHAYVATGECADKAGAYAIQGGASYFVDCVDGSYTNVIGLPLPRLVELLRPYCR